MLFWIYFKKRKSYICIFHNFQALKQGMLLKSFLVRDTLQWRHNGHDSISNHQPHDCLLNGLFRRRSKKTWKLRVTGLCAENSLGPVNSLHKWPVTRKMFPFDDVIMRDPSILQSHYHGYWWCGDARSQGIISHGNDGIDLLVLNIPISSSEELTY